MMTQVRTAAPRRLQKAVAEVAAEVAAAEEVACRTYEEVGGPNARWVACDAAVRHLEDCGWQKVAVTDAADLLRKNSWLQAEVTHLPGEAPKVRLYVANIEERDGRWVLCTYAWTKDGGWQRV